VNFSNDGLTLWYGTPDAPAPGDAGVVPRRGAALIVGVHPASPTHTLVVRYRVDGGAEQTVAGRELRVDHGRQAQYFGVTFPELREGATVEYVPVFGSLGRQVPSVTSASRFPSKFQLGPRAATAAEPSRPAVVAPIFAGGDTRRFTASLDFVASVAVSFSPPQYVGDTPGGMRVNFVVESGTVEGKGFKGTVLPGSADNLLVRRDGIGQENVHAAFATADGARLDVEAGGYVDFGADGYRRALAQDLPDRAPIVITPLISTRHPRYRGLGRVQCVAVGYTNLAANRARYCVYAATSRAVK
jgi:hypothetical protein